MENNEGDLLGESGYSSSGKIEKKRLFFTLIIMHFPKCLQRIQVPCGQIPLEKFFEIHLEVSQFTLSYQI